jgi:hypothetical protein
MRGDITLAGVTLTLEEWEALDSLSRRMLLSLCAGPEGEPDLVEAASAPAERNADVVALYDLLAT